MNRNGLIGLAAAVAVLVGILGYVWSLVSPYATSGGRASRKSAPVSMPAPPVGELAIPRGAPGAPTVLTSAQPYSTQGIGGYAARRQRLEAIVQEQLQQNRDDLIQSAEEQADIRSKALADEHRQAAEVETEKLNTEFAEKQRREVLKGSGTILNKELSTIALRKSAPVLPGFEDHNGSAELKVREQELKALQDAQKASLDQLAMERTEALERIRRQHAEDAQTASEALRADLKREAEERADAEASKLREDLSRGFELAPGPAMASSEVGPAVDSLNARSRQVHASVSAKLAAYQAAVKQARKQQEAQKRRMARAVAR